MTISSFLFSRNPHHLNVQVWNLKNNKQTTRKPIIFPHTVLVNWKLVPFCRGRRDRFSYQHLKYTPALLRNRLTALSSLQSPLDATNQPCCVTLHSRCEKPPTTQCQNKISPRLFLIQQQQWQEGCQVHRRGLPLVNGLLSYNKAYAR